MSSYPLGLGCPPAVRVKICGITSVDDLNAAVSVGAHAIGLNFFPPSPRALTVQRAAVLAKCTPPFLNVVALFVNPERQVVEDVLAAVPSVSTLQFHGTEPPEFCSSFGRPYIKSVGVRGEFDIAAEMGRYIDAAAMLLDSFDPVIWGGTGRSFDWSKIPENRTKLLVLAGGLNPDNVEDAIRKVQPYAVDVCGGVESSPGVKDPDKLISFMRSVERVSR